MCLFIKFINDDINCSHKCSCKSFRMTCLMNNEKLISLGGLSVMLLSRLPRLFVVRTQIHLFYQRRQLHISSFMSFQSPKSFKMTCLMNNEKLMNLGGLSLLLPSPSTEFALSRCLIFATFSFYQRQHLLSSKA